jgi:hypothetical protein
MTMLTPRRARAALLSLSTLLAASGCVDPVNMDRPQIQRGTLGEELFQQIHRDVARTPNNGAAKAGAMEDAHDDFVWAIDTMLPHDVIPSFESLALDLLPLMDDNALPDLIRKLGFIYEDIANDPDVRDAWARAHQLRQGLESAGADSDLMQRILAYPRLRDLTEFTVHLILDHDGLGPDGQEAPQENDFVRRLLRSLRDSLRRPDDPTDLHRNMAVMTDLLLDPDPRFGNVPDLSPMWAVRPDARGIPMVAPDNGSLPLQFVDNDGDGLADVDARGAFVDAQGQPFVLRPYDTPGTVTQVQPGVHLGRDQDGRAFVDDGSYVYDYLDLNQTTLGYLVRRTPDLIDRSVLTDTFIGLEGILGDLDTSGEYPHYTTDTPLLDLTDALFKTAEIDTLPDVLELASILLDQHESTLATFLSVSDHNADINDALGAHMEPNNGFLDDLLPYLYQFVQNKGLLADLLDVMSGPWLQRYADAALELLTTSNPAIRPALDGPYNTAAAACIQANALGSEGRYDCLRAIDAFEIFSGDVDFDLPETDGNVSLHQRLLHLIYDAAGVPFSMEITHLDAFGFDLTSTATDLGPLLTIPDVGAAFLDSVAGNFCLQDYVNVDRIEQNNLLGPLLDLADAVNLFAPDDSVASIVTSLLVYLSDGLGVHLDACPGPDELLRFFNLPTLSMSLAGGAINATLADAYDKEGYLFREHMGDVLYAAEASGAIEALNHIVRPFSLRGLSPLLAQALAALYRYFPEPGSNYVQADGSPADFTYDGLRRHEPALIQIFQEGRFIAVNQELSGILLNTQLADGTPVPDLLEGLITHLLDQNAGVVDRQGRNLATRGDGVQTPMTRYYLLSDAFHAIDDRLDEHPEARDAWDRASDALQDLVLKVDDDSSGRGYFDDPGSPAMAGVLTAHLARDVRRHMEAGDFFDRLHTAYPDYVQRLLTSRGLAAALQMVDSVRSNPDDQALFDSFLTYLTSSDASTPRTGLTVLYDLLMDTTDGVGYTDVASFYANLLDPDRRFDVGTTAGLPLLTHAASVLRDVLDVDPDDVGIDLLRRGLIPPEGHEAPLAVLARVIREVHRLAPGDPGLMTAGDLQHLYTALYEYIRDDFKGAERAFDIIQNRSGQPQGN